MGYKQKLVGFPGRAPKPRAGVSEVVAKKTTAELQEALSEHAFNSLNSAANVITTPYSRSACEAVYQARYAIAHAVEGGVDALYKSFHIPAIGTVISHGNSAFGMSMGRGSGHLDFDNLANKNNKKRELRSERPFTKKREKLGLVQQMYGLPTLGWAGETTVHKITWNYRMDIWEVCGKGNEGSAPGEMNGMKYMIGNLKKFLFPQSADLEQSKLLDIHFYFDSQFKKILGASAGLFGAVFMDLLQPFLHAGFERVKNVDPSALLPQIKATSNIAPN